MKIILKRCSLTVVAAFLCLSGANSMAWDHPGHMTTAAIAFSEIERVRPELAEALGLLFLKHPDPAPFWVAAGEAKGKERTRRMFLECARWADDSKFTNNDRLTWHTARWPVIADDAPPESHDVVAARQGRPTGQGIEALELVYSMISNPESSPTERVWALCWLMHIAGDIHQPFHVSDIFSEQFPAGNMAGSMGYVMDPVTETPITLHILWDSNVLRLPTVDSVDQHAAEFMEKYPRSVFPTLEATPITQPGFFRAWTKESHQIALDWAADLEMAVDPDTDQTSEELVAKMVNFILNGVAPIDDAPDLPAGYWDKLQITTEKRITLAGYRLADLILAAADDIEAQRKFVYR